MEEEPHNSTVTEAPPEPVGPEVPNEKPEPTFPPLELEELQKMEPIALQEWFTQAEIRPHPGRTRHQFILDLVRHAVARGAAGADERLSRVA